MIFPGQTWVGTRTFTQAEYDAVARLTGDDNPIHVDPEFCKNTRFGKTLAHGMFLYGVLTGALANLWPGRAYLQLSQALKFPGPTYTDEPMTIQLTVVQVDGDNITVDASLSGPHGPACEGRTQVRLLEAP